MHHKQNCQGAFDNIGATTEGYAQENQDLRKLELEAYRAAIYLRDWTDTRENQGIQTHRGDGAGQPGSIPQDNKEWAGPSGDRSATLRKGTK